METPQQVDSLFVFEAGSINTIINDNHGTIYTNRSGETEEGCVEMDATDEQIVGELLGIFYGDTEKAQDFLIKVKTMKGTDICVYVKKLVKERIISEMSFKKDLWEVLHNHGIYKATYRNWTAQVS